MFRALIVRGDRRRLEGIARAVGPMLPDGNASLLDVGCGSGALAERLARIRPDLRVTGVDVVMPPDCRIRTLRYDGRALPFADDSFDIVLCADMLHHTSDPEAVLREAARVARARVIVKDHRADGWWDRQILTALDWIGNVGTGVPMPFNFLSSWQWQALFDRVGLTVETEHHGLRYWPWPVSQLIDRELHFAVKLCAQKLSE